MDVDVESMLAFCLHAALLVMLLGENKMSSYKVDFIITGYLTTLLCASYLYPAFDPAMKGFLVLGASVALVGGIVGGVLALLIPSLVSGISLGLIFSLYAFSMIYGISGGALLEQRVSMIVTIICFSVGLAMSHLCTWYREMKWSLGVAMIFVLAVDSLDEFDMMKSLVFNLQQQVAEEFGTPINLDHHGRSHLSEEVLSMCESSGSMLVCHPHLLGYLVAWPVLSVLFCCFGRFIVSDMTSFPFCFCPSPKGRNRKGYAPVRREDDDPLISNRGEEGKSAKSAPQRTFMYPDSLECNYFDPDNLPIAVQAYAQPIFQSVQSLSAEIGFQVDNSRNQAEHLLMMLTNEAQKGDHLAPTLPPQRLHTKMFRNYEKWCKSLGIKPNFTPTECYNGTSYVAKLEDMLVFLLVWGESANLRHMPECLCFLYHKTMQDHLSLALKKHFATNNVVFYPGYFLDMVVAPIYDVVSKSIKSGGDHSGRKTYDDFNEFFWSSDCLQYVHHHAYVGISSCESGAVNADDNRTTVSEALMRSTKTYIEKRSWLHPVKSFHRIIEWHVVTFSILATIAFHGALVWPVSYTLTIASFVFLEINLMNLLWVCLDVWANFPTSSMTGPNVCGYVLRLLVGYVVLFYQVVYFHWAFRSDEVEAAQSMRSYGDSSFWWWQYVWLSLLSLVFYMCNMLLNIFPVLESYFLNWNADVLQAVLSICYPFSELYVGKNVHTNQRECLGYFLFWVVLISFKLWFGYVYIVNPVVGPSIEMYDDYMNYPSVSFFRTLSLYVVWWLPHFMVYLIDMSIWFACLSSAVGGMSALLERQGAVRTSFDLRQHFMKLPFAFSQKLLPSSEFDGKGQKSLQRSASRVSTTGLPVASDSLIEKGDNISSLSTRPKSSNHLYDSFRQNEQEKPSVPKSSKGDSMLEEFLDVRSRRWVNFATVWNEVILSLRDGDLLSNAERDVLLFCHFDWLSKPVYLPLYQTAGRVETALHDFKNAAAMYHMESEPTKKMLITEQLRSSFDIPTWEAVGEMWELVQWVMCELMGPVHSDDAIYIFKMLGKWSASNEIYEHVALNGLPTILSQIYSIVATLKGAAPSRAKSPIVSADLSLQYVNEAPIPATDSTSTGSGRIKKSISTGFLSAFDYDATVEQSENADSTAMRKYIKLQPFRRTDHLGDRVRDKIREDLRSVLTNLKNAIRNGGSGKNSQVSETAQDMLDRITFVLSMERGFMWSDVYASSQIDSLAKDSRLKGVASKIVGLCKLRQTEIEPVSPEARRRLHFFVNSLFMTMPYVPSMVFSKEYTCMTPFYSEDVLLTRGDLESKNSDGVSTILYLQTLYKNDWHNFLERIGCADDQNIWSKAKLQDTRMWASMRAQTLFRTVEGMMFTEKAIRLLSKIEGLTPRTIDVMAKLKFSYVVACQAYANMKKVGDHKADDIEFLLARFPNLRVAYIETVRMSHQEESPSFYSVLIKHNESSQLEGDVFGDSNIATDTSKTSNKSQTRSVTEVYRVKLPGNPVLGEGKPENQNHAVIFTRGRYLQAIDMNQAGYFEESLKMRNLLQEFEDGYKILGFREHIFTGSVSSVANYMALQELSFVTLGQRVLAFPLHIRQHYGHPDMFDKLYVMTEGGMSKASKGINLSEDVFAGFNATIRGHKVGFQEYVHVGKGRDVGLQQTYKFEAKLSQGNAEQSLSRDMSRICQRLDFFRLMSFYYGGIGHYVTNTIVMLTLFLVVYIMVGTAIFNEEGINGRSINPQGAFQMMLAGMGLLQTLPLCATLTVEKGLIPMLQEISYMIVSGGPLYFIFHIQTKSFYFVQTILAGGAMYRPTGRGFVIRHSPFDENWRFFASSHIYFGFEMMVSLILYGLYTKSDQFFGLTWSIWLAVVSFILGPFWFNPLSFESPKVLEDYRLWMQWMHEPGGSSEQSWRTWWKEENSFIKKLSTTTKLYLVLVKCSLWFIVAVGLFGRQFFKSPREQGRLVELVAVVLFYLLCRHVLHHMEKTCGYALRRLLQYAISICALVLLLLLFLHHPHYLRYTVAMYYFCCGASYLILLMGYNDLILVAFKIHDVIVGHFIFAVLLLMSVLQMGYLQTWLLYHNALSTGVVIEDVLKFARRSKESSSVEEGYSITELRKQLAEQQQLIDQLMKGHVNSRQETTAFKSSSREEQSLARDTNHSFYGATKSDDNVFNRDVQSDATRKSNGPEKSATVSKNKSGSELEARNTNFVFSQPPTLPPR